MVYDLVLVKRVREYLENIPNIEVNEQKMFGGLAFMINGKMCINVSEDQLMCRFDPDRTAEIAARKGYVQMIMKGKVFKGYCYVEPIGFEHPKDFKFWMDLCLDFNERAKSSKKRI